jgi:hypothetical protein
MGIEIWWQGVAEDDRCVAGDHASDFQQGPLPQWCPFCNHPINAAIEQWDRVGTP